MAVILRYYTEIASNLKAKNYVKLVAYRIQVCLQQECSPKNSFQQMIYGETHQCSVHISVVQLLIFSKASTAVTGGVALVDSR